MKKMILTLPAMALGLLLLSAPAANADDWGFWIGDDDWRVRVSTGDHHHRPVYRRPVHHEPAHVCRYEWRRVVVQEPGRYETILIPGRWETQYDHCGRLVRVWVPARYEQRFVPGASRTEWQRVMVCQH